MRSGDLPPELGTRVDVVGPAEGATRRGAGVELRCAVLPPAILGRLRLPTMPGKDKGRLPSLKPLLAANRSFSPDCAAFGPKKGAKPIFWKAGVHITRRRER